MSKYRTCIFSALIAVVLAFVPLGSLWADLYLNAIGDLSWDRVQNPTGPSPFLIGVSSNSDAPFDNKLNAFNIGIRILPTAGALGTISIQSVTIPNSNAVFTSFAVSPSLVSVQDFQVINGENAVFENVMIPATGRSLFQAQLFSPNSLAQGKFEIYAERETTNYFTTTTFDGAKFQNVPLNGVANGVYLGSLTVTAVPEPSSLLVAILAGIALSGFRRVMSRLRRRNNAIGFFENPTKSSQVL